MLYTSLMLRIRNQWLTIFFALDGMRGCRPYMSDLNHTSWQILLNSLFICNRDNRTSGAARKIAIEYGIPTKRSSDSAINVTSGTTCHV